MLKEQDRTKLDGIVSQMTANGESDADIQFVVDDFKGKYATEDGGIIDTAKDIYGKVSDVMKRGAIDVASGEALTVSSVLSGLEWLGLKGAGKYADKINAAVQKSAPLEQNFTDKLLSGVGSAAIFFVPGVGIARLASSVAKVSPTLAYLFGNSASTALEAMSEAGSVYEENTSAGKSESEASGAATKTFWANAILIGITNRYGVFNENVTGALKKAIVSAPVEGFQEGAQQIISNLNTGRPWYEGVAESSAIGAIIGGGMGAMEQAVGIPPRKDREKLEEGAKDMMAQGKTPAEVKLELLKTLPPKVVDEVVNAVTPIESAQEQDNYISQQLASGLTPTEVALGLSEKMNPDHAIARVNEIVARGEKKMPEKIAPTGEGAKKAGEELAALSEKVDKKILDKKTSEISDDILAAQDSLDAEVASIKESISKMEQKVSSAPARSQEKKDAKLALEKERTRLRKVEADFNDKAYNNTQAVRTFITGFIKDDLKIELTPEQEQNALDEIATRLYDTTDRSNKSVRTITEEVVGQFAGTKKIPDMTDDALLSRRAEILDEDLELETQEKEFDDISAEAEKRGLIDLETGEVKKKEKKKPVGIQVGDVINTKGGSNMKGDVTVISIEKQSVRFKDSEGMEYAGMNKATVEKLLKEGAWSSKGENKTQKEQVKEVLAKKGIASVKEVAKETGILEPNIRRILGVGAKEGAFERIADGVYRLTVGDQEIAVVIPADARETLPQLVKDGFKADMVFLDIPYDLAGNKGGNRMNKAKGTLYETISVEDFGDVVENISKILRDDSKPVVYMISQSETSKKRAELYTKKLLDAGFIPLARGNYYKMSKKGTRLTMPMRSTALPPEGIIILNKSGEIDTSTFKDLEFKLVRPKGYQTEKPAELLHSLITMTTKEGDVVFDPFAGSGVTGEQAIKTGRKTVLIEKSVAAVKEHIIPRLEKAVSETEVLKPGIIARSAVPDKIKTDTVNGNDIVTLYHATSAESARDVLRDGYMRVGEGLREGTKASFWSMDKEYAKQFGDYIIEIKVRLGDKSLIWHDDSELEYAKDIKIEPVLDKTEKTLAKGTILYHGTSEENTDSIRAGNISPTDDETATYGKGIYLTEDKKVAQDYADEFDNGEVMSIELKKDTLLYQPTSDERIDLIDLMGKEQDEKIAELLGDKYDGFYLPIMPEHLGDGSPQVVFYDKDDIPAGKIGTLDNLLKPSTLKGNEKDTTNRGSKTDAGGVSETLPVGGAESSDTGGATEVPRNNNKDRPSQRGGKLGERPRLTNEEIEKIVSSVAEISDTKEVELTGEITGEILDAANQYTPGGTAKEGRGILDEYYTEEQVVDMVKSLLDFPAKDLRIIEPSVGTGNFLYAIPEIGNHKVAALEINPTTAKIAKIFHPTARVFNKAFEELFIGERGERIAIEPTNQADLIIGNPPYGEHRGKYLGLGEEKGIKKYEDYFIKRGIDMLKEGGTLAMVVPSSYIDRKMDIKNATLVVAYRLPEGVFKGTKIGTDIVIFKKKLGASTRIGGYFTNNPTNILGEVKSRKNRFGKTETFIDGDIESAQALFDQHRNDSKAKGILKDLKIKPTKENIEEASEAIEEAGEGAKALIKEEEKSEKRIGKKTIEKKVVKKAIAKDDTIVPLAAQFAEVSESELELWRKTNAEGYVETPTDEDKKSLNFSMGNWYNDFNYSQGDIYERLRLLELEKKELGNKQYENQKAKLEAVLPTPERIDDIKLSPNHTFVSELKLGEMDGQPSTLRSKFLEWMGTLPRQAFGDSSQWEVRGYVNNEIVTGSDKDRNELTRNRRRVMADSLFSKFLKEELDDTTRRAVEDEYNKTYNFYHTPDYSKVPMFSDIHASFKGGKFTLNDAQREGIGRLVNRGVGILAHEVGFGKTISGVLAAHETMTRGWAKRPLIIAPNENVYTQWVKTIQDLVPNAKLNLLGNLGASYKGDLSTLKIEDGTFTLVTYEGLKRLSFKDETYSKMAGKFSYIADDLNAHKTKRGEAQKEEGVKGIAGGMKKGTRSDLFFEDLGFDHFTFDEIHNANHIVSKAKIEKGKASEFSRFSINPSDIGIKTWLATQYIQDKMNGRNVNLLSATPFTNHPLEYYSILSLVADKSLQKMRLGNVNDFFGSFMEANHEYEFKADGSYKPKTDVRRIKNYRQWRNLLGAYIDFKQDAPGIKRPNRLQQTYEIPQNTLTQEMNTKAQGIFEEDERESGKGAKVLRAINEFRKIAFSPYASKFSQEVTPEHYKEIVENSPKLATVMGIIAQNKKDKPEAGQIVYSEVGVDFFPLLKNYLVKEVGFKTNEVEIITGKTAKPTRITIQDNFNEGKIKILIGSEAISEGMNLQQNTTDMHLLSLPWNFTALRQVIGRAWRQGNDWSNVRINQYFIQDSIDIFLSQKLDNKQRRYEAAIASNANEVDVGDVSYNEMKSELIVDPEKRAKFEIEGQKEQLKADIMQSKAELAFATRKLEKINTLMEKIKDDTDGLKKENEKSEPEEFWVNRYEKDIKNNKKELGEEIAKLKAKDIDVDTLLEKKEEGEKHIAELETQEKAIEATYADRVKEIVATLPKRQFFSKDILDKFVAERAEHNKTFYNASQAPVEETVTVEKQVKEIKNAAGTKVVKTKKTTKAVKKVKTVPLIPEEFADSEVYYHGTPTAEQANAIRSSGFATEEVYLTKDYALALEDYAGKRNNIIAVLVKKGAKPLKKTNVSDTHPHYKVSDIFILPKEVITEVDVENYIAEQAPKKGTKDQRVLGVLSDGSLNAAQKVGEILNVKQEGKEFKDTGERVTGSKKERAAINTVLENGDAAIIAEMIKTLGADAIAETLHKDEILEDAVKPDVEKDKADKVPAFVAGWKQKVLNSIGRTPSLVSKEGRYSSVQQVPEKIMLPFLTNYGDYLRTFVKELADVKTAEQAEVFRDKYRYSFVESIPAQDKEQPDYAPSVSTGVLGRTIKSAIEDIREYTSAYGILYEIKSVKKVLESGVFKEEEASKNYPWTGLSSYGFRTDNFKTKKEAEESMTKERIAEVKELLEAREEKLQNDYDYYLPKKKTKSDDVDLSHGNFKPLDRVVRSEPDISDDKINPETMTKEMGFKSVQLGNYMDDATAKEHIRYTIGAVKDMSKLLAIDFPKVMNKMGLSLALGARGGGKANAHYEPSHNIINLTKGRGDGSFFHEIVHFLDWTTNKSGYRGKWSGGKERYYRQDTLDSATLNLIQALTGDKIRKVKEFVPRDDAHVLENKENYTMKARARGETFESVLATAKNNTYAGHALQDVADVYRQTIKEEMDVYHEETEFFKNAILLGGGKRDAYWARPHELLARAGQAYIEDKMIAAGMKNNYLTRTTIGESKAYPQGEERKIFNTYFDRVFAELSARYPLEKQGELPSEPRFKLSDFLYERPEVGMTEAGKYLTDVKKRLNLDFDVYFADVILSNRGDTKSKNRIEAWGVTYDNTITLTKEMARHTAPHEVVHLTLSNMDKLKIFQRNGITRDKVLYAKATEMGLVGKDGTYNVGYWGEVEEKIALDFEKYLDEKYLPTGIIMRFFALLKREITRLARAIVGTKGDIVKDYYDILDEGVALEEEYVRLENNGIIDAFVEEAGNEVFDFSVIEGGKFKLKEEPDKRMQTLKSKYNDVVIKQEELEKNTEAWKTDLLKEIVKKADTAKLVDETPESITGDFGKPGLIRFTKRTPPVGELTERGVAEVESLEFENVEEAQQEINAYLQRKTQLISTRNRLRELRLQISQARKDKKLDASVLRDVERKLKMRKRYLEQKDYYVGMGIGRGKKEQMKMIHHRSRVIRDIQDQFAIGDKRAKDIIGGFGRQRIHLMSEQQFNDFTIEFYNRAEALGNQLSAQDEVKALIAENQFGKWENLQKAMGLPSIEKMTEEQAQSFVEVLSKYQFGDVFLTKRELETIHRTDWGEIETERELLDKIKSNMGFGREELKNLTARNVGDYTPWIRLARKHPFFNWLVGKRVEADIQATREYVSIENDTNPLAHAAISSRRKLMGIKERVIDIVIPTQPIIRGFLEIGDKATYAEKNKMTKEELNYAYYIIGQNWNFYEYLKQFGTKEIENYMTHSRRNFFEALKDEGLMVAFREVFTSQKEDVAGFKILDDETGNVLAFDKFLGNMLHRTGRLVPSENVTRVFLEYARAVSKKRAMDKFIPEAMIAVQAHKAVVGTTPKGLTKDPTLEKFVKEFLNNAKGRKIKWITKQGSTSDIALRAGVAWVAIKYLGGNLASAIGNVMGDFTAIFWELDIREQARGVARSIVHPLDSHAINKQFRFFTGRNPIVELFDAKYHLPMRLKNALMVFMALGAFQSNKFFLRAKMSDEEFKTGVIGDKRLVEIANALSRVKPNQFYVKSLAGNTTAGNATFQFGTWAIAITNTVLSDGQEVVKMLANRDVKKALTSREAQKLLKFGIMAGMLLWLTSLIDVDDDDYTLWGRTIRSIRNNLNTLVQALQFTTDISNYGLIIKEIILWQTALKQLFTQEQYKQDGVGYQIGDPKWIRAGERIITPNALRQFFPKEKESAKESQIEEAVRTGDFNAEEIAQAISPDWNDPEKMDAEAQERKIASVKMLYAVRKNYPDNPLVDIILNTVDNNEEKVKKMIEYNKQTGEVYSELKSLYRDSRICADPKKRTGCLVSGKLLKEYAIAERKQ